MKNKIPKKHGLLKYFLAGLAVAAVLFSIITLTKKDDEMPKVKKAHIWTAETDSLFVKNCYNKYRPQIRDDMAKQEVTKIFCKCMLDKVKMQYEEKDIDNIRDDEIVRWDGECRAELSNPGFLK